MLITGIHSVSDIANRYRFLSLYRIVTRRICPGNSAYVAASHAKIESVAPHVVRVCNTRTDLCESPHWDLLDFSTKLHLAHSSGRWCRPSAWRSLQTFIGVGAMQKREFQARPFAEMLRTAESDWSTREIPRCACKHRADWARHNRFPSWWSQQGAIACLALFGWPSDRRCHPEDDKKWHVRIWWIMNS